MIRIRTIMTGGAGGPYLSVMHFDGETPLAAQDAATAARTFWDGVKAVIYTGLSVQVDTVALQVVEETGTIVAAYPVTAAVVAGGGTGEALPYATQGLLRWRTGAYVNGREVRGRTFVPRPSEADNTSGFPAAAYATVLQNAGNALIASASANFGVWKKPPLPVPPGVPGQFIPVTAAQVWSNWSVLKSRRD